MGLFSKKQKVQDDNSYTFTLAKKDAEVKYGEVSGFFEFRGDIFYRAKGVSGKCITTGEAFTNLVKNKYPEEFKDMTAMKISAILVMPLIVTK